MYEVHRARVDRAYQRMQTVSAGPHAPADARRAAAELEAVLREATAVASERLRQAQPRVASSGRWRRRRTSRATSPAVARWSRELVRLSEIAVWLRHTTLDDLGLHVPTTVRVGNYAANGPHVAGLGDGGTDLVELHEPRIGVDLRAIVDGDGPAPGVAGTPVTVPASTPTRAA